MTFTQSVKTCFNKFAIIDGRASRSEYWWFALAFLPVLALHSGLNLFTLRNIQYEIVDLPEFAQLIIGIASMFSFYLWIVFLVPYVAVSVRRLHDVGRSGWWLLPPSLFGSIGSYIGESNFQSPAIANSGLVLLPAFYVSGALVLYWNLRRGTKDANRYGESIVVE